MLTATYKNLAQGHVGHVIALTNDEVTDLAAGNTVILTLGGGSIEMRFYLTSDERQQNLTDAIARIAVQHALDDVKVIVQK